MRTREKLLPFVNWNVGDGATCKVYGQPWFKGATIFIATTSDERKLLLKDLIDEDTGTWCAEELIQRFGYQNFLQIVASVRAPREDVGEDVLTFTKSANGWFSVKIAYKLLKENESSTRGNRGALASGSTSVWQLIWKMGKILPRIRIFVWKLLHGALPLAEILSKRLSKGDSTCVIYGQGVETVEHMLFYCSFARACWFRGPLCLMSDGISDIATGFENIVGRGEEFWTLAANSAWSIWRCRNDACYGGNLPSFEKYTKYLNQICTETMIAASGQSSGGGNRPAEEVSIVTTYKCYIDGSWIHSWKGGLGFVLIREEELVAFRASEARACCPLHAEAMALREALLFVKEQGISSCTFLTDNRTLANDSTDTQPPLKADWRAYKEIYEIWKMFKEEGFECRHINRSQNGVADNLAKAGTYIAGGYTGFTYPMFNQQSITRDLHMD